MESHPLERRQFSRVSFDADVTVQQEDHTYHSQLVDISLNGVLITTPRNYEIRTDMPCTLVVVLAQDVEIRMQVTLVHSSSDLLGFHCSSIDMESMTHLRRLVEMNMTDPRASERVLTEMLKRHRASA